MRPVVTAFILLALCAVLVGLEFDELVSLELGHTVAMITAVFSVVLILMAPENPVAEGAAGAMIAFILAAVFHDYVTLAESIPVQGAVVSYLEIMNEIAMALVGLAYLMGLSPPEKKSYINEFYKDSVWGRVIKE
jgi:hypothetical protein